MTATISNDTCCGCGACANVCPRQAIEMKPNGEGFLYPAVNSKLCVDCHLCEQVCSVCKTYSSRQPLQVFCAINCNKEQRLQSSSGGMWKLLADYLLHDNGYVCGARFIGSKGVFHDVTNDVDICASFCGSKYVQSKMDDCYKKIKALLDDGKKVIFSGTPCQVVALKEYLRKPCQSLFTVDFLCHGVPSPMVFRRYTEERTGISLKDINNVSFRDKTYGWRNYRLCCECVAGKSDHGYSATIQEDLYLRGFVESLFLRPSCYQCRFRNFQGLSDITLGDFWNIHKFCPKKDDDYGASLVFVHTQAGKELLKKIEADISKQELSFKKLSPYLHSLHYSPTLPSCRNSFFEMVKKEDIVPVLERLLPKEPFVSRKSLKHYLTRLYFSIVRRISQWR